MVLSVRYQWGFPHGVISPWTRPQGDVDHPRFCSRRVRLLATQNETSWRCFPTPQPHMGFRNHVFPSASSKAFTGSCSIILGRTMVLVIAVTCMFMSNSML